MQPQLKVISTERVNQIIDEAFALLMSPGIKVHHDGARQMLAEAGAQVDNSSQVARIPEKVARKALESVPHEFTLYNQDGEAAVIYGGDAVHFDPGSSAVSVLDGDAMKHRSATTDDLVKIIKVADSLWQYDAQSTSLVCGDIPKDIGDLYRLYLVMLLSKKPVVTGSFATKNTNIMIDMLAIYAGGREALRQKPTAVFDACPSPPLVWTDFGVQNLIDLALAGVPAEMVSMPLSGAAAPVTLLGSVVQHAAESISGMTIHQLANPGAPIVWGGAPAIMDMRHGTTPMGAVETAMIDVAYAQVGKSFGFPTHTYLCASDAKIVDYQAGMESGTSAMIGALAGINMISGAGMLDFLASMSLEKLLIDAEAIGMAKRMLQGMLVHTETLATEMFEDFNFKGDFLKQRLTRQLVRKEQYLPSKVIDRGSIRTWQQEGATDTFARAKTHVRDVLAAYQAPDTAPEKVAELKGMVSRLAKEAGLDQLPQI